VFSEVGLFGLGKGPFVNDVDRDEGSEIVLLWLFRERKESCGIG
jgi:hypothetical protein